jgi:competence protein ComEC
VAIGFIAGIILAQYLPLPLESVLFIAAFTAVLFLIFIRPRELKGFCPLLIFILAASAGFVHLSSASHFPSHHIKNFLVKERRLVALEGRVADLPEVKYFPPQESLYGEEYWRTSFILSAQRIRGQETLPASGQVQVFIYDKLEGLRYGDEVRIKGWLASPRPPTNPGEFNYKAALQRKGIYAILSSTRAANLKVLGHRFGNPFFRAVYSIRRKAERIIEVTLPEKEGRLLAALLLGRREALSKEAEERLVRSGVVHFFAVSGLHVGIVAGFFWIILRALGAKRSLAAGVVILVAVFYGSLTGARPSAMRAVVWVVILVLGTALRRPADYLNSLAAASILILLYRPGGLFSPGFQLSFLAVLAIFYLSPLFYAALSRLLIPSPTPLDLTLRDRLLWRVRSYVIRYLAVSLAVWAALAPLIARYFNLVTPLVPLLNLVLFPLIWAILVFGLLGIGISLIFGQIVGSVALFIPRVSLMAMEGILGFAGHIPALYIYLAAPSLIFILVIYLFFGLIILSERVRLRPALAVVPLLIFINFGVYKNALSLKDKNLELAVLDVGWGNSVVIRHREAGTILFDAGSLTRSNIGEYTLAPYLWKKGVRKIDLLILSHGHADHTNGVKELLARFPVGLVVANRRFAEAEDGEGLSREFARRKVPVKYVAAGDEIKGLSGVEIKVLSPPRLLVAEEHFSINDYSLALNLRYGTTEFILCGDLEEKALIYLAGHLRVFASVPYAPEKRDFLLVPHHGGWTPYARQFAGKIRPQIAVISADDSPSAQNAIRLYRTAGAEVFLTSDAGAVIINSDGKGLSTHTFILKNITEPRK